MASNDPAVTTLLQQLDAMDIHKARRLVLSRHWGGGPYQSVAEGWLDSKERLLNDAREAESLSISRKALANSRSANIIAITAIICSVTIPIVSAFINS